jgi:hypothetical protein
MIATIPDSIESALAAFANATRAEATEPNGNNERETALSLRILRSMIASELSDAREEGGRIAMGWTEQEND